MVKSSEITDEKRNAQHYTPPELAQFLARKAVAAIKSNPKTLTVVDPACGEGELLIAAAKAIRDAGHVATIRII